MVWYNLDHRRDMESTFGDYVKARRLDLEIGLREFAERIGVEASNYSKIERGLKSAPTGDRLIPYVKALEFEVGSKEHKLMDDMAHVANGHIPTTMLSDERLAGKLPLLFNGIANGAFSEEQIDEILATVREAHRPEPEVATKLD
jgi:transcriptional regulator with XRE-family HTH domain